MDVEPQYVCEAYVITFFPGAHTSCNKIDVTNTSQHLNSSRAILLFYITYVNAPYTPFNSLKTNECVRGENFVIKVFNELPRADVYGPRMKS